MRKTSKRLLLSLAAMFFAAAFGYGANAEATASQLFQEVPSISPQAQ